MTDGNTDAINRHLADREEHDAWQEGRDAIEALADAEERIVELEAQNRELALQVLASDGQAQDAYARQVELEAQIRANPKVKALVEALKICRDELDAYSKNEYPSNYPAHDMRES